MIFHKTKLAGPLLLELEKNVDGRGFFARSFCIRDFEKQGVVFNVVQCNLSYNSCAGTIRGLHYQRPPDEEAKIVRVISGSIFDVIVDLREGSATYGRWESFQLNAKTRSSLYIPSGFAHGFQALEDNTELLYMMSAFYNPANSTGIRYDDPTLAIPWPSVEPVNISEKDINLPFLPQNNAAVSCIAEEGTGTENLS